MFKRNCSTHSKALTEFQWSATRSVFQKSCYFLRIRGISPTPQRWNFWIYDACFLIYWGGIPFCIRVKVNKFGGYKVIGSSFLRILTLEGVLRVPDCNASLGRPIYPLNIFTHYAESLRALPGRAIDVSADTCSIWVFFLCLACIIDDSLPQNHGKVLSREI